MKSESKLVPFIYYVCAYFTLMLHCGEW